MGQRDQRLQCVGTIFVPGKYNLVFDDSNESQAPSRLVTDRGNLYWVIPHSTMSTEEVGAFVLPERRWEFPLPSMPLVVDSLPPGGLHALMTRRNCAGGVKLLTTATVNATQYLLCHPSCTH